jgi:hypothetical protein
VSQNTLIPTTATSAAPAVAAPQTWLLSPARWCLSATALWSKTPRGLPRCLLTICQQVTFRALQGMSAGASVVVVHAIIRDMLEPVDAQLVMRSIVALALTSLAMPSMWIVAWFWVKPRGTRGCADLVAVGFFEALNPVKAPCMNS